MLVVVDLQRLGQTPVGSLVPISGTDVITGQPYEHCAYLPAPLPTELSLRSSTWNVVTQAEAALGRLDEASRQMPKPSLLRRPTLRQEAQSTSALEGTFAPFETVLASETEGRAGLPPAVREILNYVVAAEEGFAWIADRPITLGLLAGLQHTLVADTPSEYRDAGRLRESQVVIGSRGEPIPDARFIPPPPGDQLRAGVDDWIAWVDEPPPDLPAVVHAALAHYQFETLHPFSDGNGRIGRLVIALQLVRYGVLAEPLLVVSPWFEARRQAYQDELLALSTFGDWDRWVRFFAEGIAASADTTRRRIERLLAWRDQTIGHVRAEGVSGVAERVAGDLIGSPILTAASVARTHEVTPQGARLALQRLVAHDVLVSRRIGGRVQFEAPRVLELLSG